MMHFKINVIVIKVGWEKQNAFVTVWANTYSFT